MITSRLEINSLKTIIVLVILYISCVLIQPSCAEIRTRSGTNSVNTNSNRNKNDGHILKKQTEEAETATSDSSSATTTSSSASSSATVNTDLMDKLSWKCANNASCLYSLTSSIVGSYRRGETVKLGFFDLVKLPTTHKPTSNLNTKSTTSSSAETGRSMSSFVNFISGNAIRIPVGPMVFSVQRAEDDDNYIEVALLKKATSTARLGGDGDSGGGGHGIIQRIKQRKEKEDKKQMQMYIPMYLAASTFGWTMVAAKAVGILTLKALAISKIALIVAAMVLMKKFMDNESEKQMYQQPEHAPYMMPYSMDYGMHSMAAAPADMMGSDMYGGGMAMHAAMGQMGAHPGHSGFEHLAAESTVHQNIAEAQNNTQVLAALNAAGLGQKVKREDAWFGRNQQQKMGFRNPYMDLMHHGYFSTKMVKFFNSMATSAARRPMVYNYLNPHAHYRQ